MANHLSKEYTTRETCRVCGNPLLVDILSLGDMHVSNFIDSEGDHQPKAPLDLVLCDLKNGGCGLLQLRHTFDSSQMYRNYWYRSGVNRMMSEALQGLSRTAEKITKLKAGDVVVDIGCNDGTLLRGYETEGLVRVGFEPAENLVPHAKEGTSEIINNFFNATDFLQKMKSLKAKVVTAIAMFYDLEDPNEFVADVAKIMEREGIFIIQMSYLPSMISQNAFDNICHEHLEYYSLASLEKLLHRHKLEVFDVELNDVNGGSFRTYIRHKGSMVGNEIEGREKRITELTELEERMGLHDKKVHEDFVKRVEEAREKVCQFIQHEAKQGKKVYVYGASTKGNTLLQFFNLNSSLIKGAAERNPIKWGKKTVGTNIPILSEADVRKEKPDYFLVLPWHFMPEFLEREREFLERGGKFIVPLPEFKVIGIEDIK